MASKTTSSRYDRRNDLTPTDEAILEALADPDTALIFTDLFAAIHLKLKAVVKANTGEEIMRLRVYERLQNLTIRGRIDKDGKLDRKRQ
jgi:hypothetical protein